jgi:competence protein ComEA
MSFPFAESESGSQVSAAREKVLRLANERLAALVGSRERAVSLESQPIVIDPPPHALRPIARIAGAFCLLIGLLVWLNRPQAVTPIVQEGTAVSVSVPNSDALDQGVVSSATLTSSGATSSGVASSPAATIVVDVEGHVRHPGLVSLPVDSRVADALAEAGGLTRRIAPGSLNLAQKVTDGQLIVVSSTQSKAGQLASAPGATSAGGGPINLNTGSETDLDALPGVGPVMAGRIIAWRTENGGFKSVADLQQVPGIGPKVFANLKPLVCI